MYPLPVFVFLLLSAVFENPCHGDEAAALSGGDVVYTVMRDDYLGKIGARFGVAVDVLARENGIANPDLIQPGQRLAIDNRHIVPEPIEDGIVINIPQRMLFFFKEGHRVAAYPAGLGRPDWPTVQGSFKVMLLKENPVWVVPSSIQEEMVRERESVRSHVPPGPDNPIGRFWIGLDALGYGIHGTIAPDSIYHFQSHGCIRLHPDDIAQLFFQMNRGLAVELIYRPVLMAEVKGRVFVEINGDIYKRAPAALETVRQLAAARGLTEKIDWPRVETLLRQKDGVARDVTRISNDGQRQ